MYTREEILAMPAGQELDVLVAEHIFEKQVRWIQDEWSDPYPIDEHETVIDNFSTEIMDAWEVVEKYHEITVKRFETMKGHRYWCKIEVNYDDDPIIAQGDTAPEAICKCALLSLLKED